MLRWNVNGVAFLRAVGGDDGNLRLLNLPCRRRRLISVRLRRLVLYRRPGWRWMVVLISTRSRIVHGAWAAYDQRTAITTELVGARAMSGRRGGVPDGDGTDGCVGNGDDVFRINPPVDKIAAMPIEIVDYRGVIINLRYLGPCHEIAAWMRVAKTSNRHKGETIPTQAEIETDADGEPVIKESNAFPIHRARRQRRPAAVLVRIPPRYP